MSYPKYTEADFQPHHLTEKEIADPRLVFYDVFDFEHLPGIRNLLWDWLKATVIGNYNRELDKRERHIIILTYEKLQRMIEAAHIMNEQYKRAKMQADTSDEEPELVSISGR